MPSRLCPTCKRLIDGDADACPHDGTRLAPIPQARSLGAAAPAAPRPPPGAPPPPRSKASPLASSQPLVQATPLKSTPVLPAARPSASLPARPPPPRPSAPLPPPTPPPPAAPPRSPLAAAGPQGAPQPALRASLAPESRGSAPSIELVETMSPESMEREGLVLDGPVEIYANGPPSIEGKLLASKYRVLRLLGEGGMGEVFLAEHEAIGKRVAIKVLRSEHAQKTDVVERFRLEARSASKIQHPNVVQVFDFGQLEDGRFYLVLEYLEGVDLADLLHQRRRLEARRALNIAFQVCAGLGAAHAVGIIHRDMKPENVFLQRGKSGMDDVKIVDFGIAKMRELSERASSNPPAPGPSRDRRITQAGSIFGTPEYMAPEQAAGSSEVDHRADIYAVGVMLYEMLTGQVPFAGDSMLATLSKHINEPPKPLSKANPEIPISPELEQVILKALAKAPSQRIQSMDAFIEELRATSEGANMLEESMRMALPLSLQGIPPSPRPSAPLELPPERQPMGSLAPLPLVTPARSSTSIARLPFDDSPTSPGGGKKSWVKPAIAGVAVAAVAAVGLALRAGAAPQDSPAASRPTSSSAPTAPALPASAADPTAALSHAAMAPPTSSQGASTGALVASAILAPASSAPESSVELRVVTIPPGAVVLKGGFQVCDSSPCDVIVQQHEAVELMAVRGELRGVARVLAQRKQVVSIPLGKHSGPLPAPPTKIAPSGGRSVAPVPMCEFVDGDLKMLRPCK